MDVDLVVANGMVVDGTGAKAFPADIGVRDGRIAVLRRPGDGDVHGAETVDANGLVVSPGFVDTNTHADWALPLAEGDRLLAPLLLQGVTSVVGGGCGFSPAPVETAHRREFEVLTGFLRDDQFQFGWGTFAELIEACSRRPPLVNVALLVGQQALRCAVAGTRPGPLSSSELNRMRELTRAALEAGAVGVSGNGGFVPGVYADRAEFDALAEEAARAGATFAVHARAYTRVSSAYPPLRGAPHHIRAVRELAALARRTGVRLQISHLGVVGRRTWPSVSELLGEIDAALEAGDDIGFDVVPYPMGVGPFQMLFPAWAVQRLAAGQMGGWARIRLRLLSRLQTRLLGLGLDDIQLMRAAEPELEHLQGLDFARIAAQMHASPINSQLDLAQRSRLAAVVSVGTYSGEGIDDAPLQQLLAHPHAAVVTNAALSIGGIPNPASHGAFPRLLGRYCRERHLFSLEEAIRRATSLPADRLGLHDLGRIAEGHRADLVILDPAKVGDGGWPEHPAGPPTGVRTVLVGGKVVAGGGEIVGASGNGRILVGASA